METTIRINLLPVRKSELEKKLDAMRQQSWTKPALLFLAASGGYLLASYGISQRENIAEQVTNLLNFTSEYSTTFKFTGAMVAGTAAYFGLQKWYQPKLILKSLLAAGLLMTKKRKMGKKMTKTAQSLLKE